MIALALFLLAVLFVLPPLDLFLFLRSRRKAQKG